MTNSLATLCIPGLACSPRLYAEQIPHLWSLGPVMVGQHSMHESMADIARSILAAAPDRFALIGLSMGGYVSFEILRQAPERVVKLALLDTSARPDSAEQTANRRAQIKQSEHIPIAAIIDAVFPRLVDKSRHGDAQLRQVIRQMADEVGAAGFVRQQTAIMARPDSRPTLGSIRCPTLVLVGEGDELIPPPVSEEIAKGIAGATLVKVPECGHCSSLEQPERVTRTLMDFLRS
jgi:pimeloyl-ACP methyl ester carboxylesterase